MTNIERFAKEKMGIVLLPAQLQMITAWVNGDMWYGPRAAGKTTAKKVLDAYIKTAVEEYKNAPVS